MKITNLLIVGLLFFLQSNAQVAKTAADDSAIIKQATSAFTLAFNNSDSAMKMAQQALE